MEITEKLFALKDEKYASFQSKLTPTLPPQCFIGVRVPLIRKLAKEYSKDPLSKDFLNTLPHQYYDENMLHALLISQMKDFDEIISRLDTFLPYVDNWAVCDSLSPKALRKNKEKLLRKIKEWIKSPHTYTVRFAVDMLMTFYLDDDFKPEYLALPASIHSEEYYIRMMVAWYYATALAKQWDEAVRYIENNLLDIWTHNKTIQKANESYRITDEQKSYLKTLKRTKE